MAPRGPYHDYGMYSAERFKRQQEQQQQAEDRRMQKDVPSRHLIQEIEQAFTQMIYRLRQVFNYYPMTSENELKCGPA
jgi:hypothetical protein